MIDANLPSPGVIPCGPKLRALTAKAISYIEVNAPVQGGTITQAKGLDDFLVAARAAIAPFVPVA